MKYYVTDILPLVPKEAHMRKPIIKQCNIKKLKTQLFIHKGMVKNNYVICIVENIAQYFKGAWKIYINRVMKTFPGHTVNRKKSK